MFSNALNGEERPMEEGKSVTIRPLSPFFINLELKDNFYVI